MSPKSESKSEPKSSTELVEAMQRVLEEKNLLQERFDLLKIKSHLLAKERDELLEEIEKKEYLLREVHHRVMNNFQLVNSLFILQSMNADKETREHLSEAMSRVMAMSMVHNQLMSSDDFSGVRFKECVHHLLDGLLPAHWSVAKRIEMSIDIDEQLCLSISDAIPCSLIINEVLTNAFKYAFPHEREGNIRIHLSARGERGYLFEIVDDGVGLSEEEIQNMLLPRAQKHLGLKIIRVLVRQLGGDLSVTGDPGTTIKIEFQSKEE